MWRVFTGKSRKKRSNYNCKKHEEPSVISAYSSTSSTPTNCQYCKVHIRKDVANLYKSKSLDNVCLFFDNLDEYHRLKRANGTCNIPEISKGKLRKSRSLRVMSDCRCEKRIRNYYISYKARLNDALWRHSFGYNGFNNKPYQNYCGNRAQHGSFHKVSASENMERNSPESSKFFKHCNKGEEYDVRVCNFSSGDSSYSNPYCKEGADVSSERRREKANDSKFAYLSDETQSKFSTSTEYEVINVGQVDVLKEFKSTIVKMREVLSRLNVQKSIEQDQAETKDNPYLEPNFKQDMETRRNIVTCHYMKNCAPTKTDVDGGSSTKDEGCTVNFSSDTTSSKFCRVNSKTITLDSTLFNYIKSHESLKSRKRTRRLNRDKTKTISKTIKMTEISQATRHQLRSNLKPRCHKCTMSRLSQSQLSFVILKPSDRSTGSSEQNKLKETFKHPNQFPTIATACMMEQKHRMSPAQKSRIPTLKTRDKKMVIANETSSNSTPFRSSTGDEDCTMKACKKLCKKCFKPDGICYKIIDEPNEDGTPEPKGGKNEVKDELSQDLASMSSSKLSNVMVSVSVPLKEIVSKIKNLCAANDTESDHLSVVAVETSSISMVQHTALIKEAKGSSSISTVRHAATQNSPTQEIVETSSINMVRSASTQDSPTKEACIKTDELLQVIPEKMSTKETDTPQPLKMFHKSTEPITPVVNSERSDQQSQKDIDKGGGETSTNKIYFSDHSTSIASNVKTKSRNIVGCTFINDPGKSSTASGFYLNQTKERRYLCQQELISRIFSETDNNVAASGQKNASYQASGPNVSNYHCGSASFKSYDTQETPTKDTDKSSIMNAPKHNQKRLKTSINLVKLVNMGTQCSSVGIEIREKRKSNRHSTVHSLIQKVIAEYFDECVDNLADYNKIKEEIETKANERNKKMVKQKKVKCKTCECQHDSRPIHKSDDSKQRYSTLCIRKNHQEKKSRASSDKMKNDEKSPDLVTISTIVRELKSIYTLAQQTKTINNLEQQEVKASENDGNCELGVNGRSQEGRKHRSIEKKERKSNIERKKSVLDDVIESAQNSNFSTLIKNVSNLFSNNLEQSREGLVESTLCKLVKDIILEKCAHMTDWKRSKLESMLTNFIKDAKLKGNKFENGISTTLHSLIKEAKSESFVAEGEQSTITDDRKFSASKQLHKKPKKERTSSVTSVHITEKTSRDGVRSSGIDEEKYQRLLERLNGLEKLTDRLAETEQQQTQKKNRVSEVYRMEKSRLDYPPVVERNVYNEHQPSQNLTKLSRKTVKVLFSKAEPKMGSKDKPLRCIVKKRLPITKIVINVDNLKVLTRECKKVIPKNITQPIVITDSTEKSRKVVRSIVTYDIQSSPQKVGTASKKVVEYANSSNESNKYGIRLGNGTPCQSIRNQAAYTIMFTKNSQNQNPHKKQYDSQSKPKEFMRFTLTKKKTITSNSENSNTPMITERSDVAIDDDLIREITQAYLKKYVMCTRTDEAPVVDNDRSLKKILEHGENLDLAYRRMANFCMFRGLLKGNNSLGYVSRKQTNIKCRKSVY